MTNAFSVLNTLTTTFEVGVILSPAVTFREATAEYLWVVLKKWEDSESTRSATFEVQSIRIRVVGTIAGQSAKVVVSVSPDDELPAWLDAKVVNMKRRANQGADMLIE